jgi:hypothetical protein
MPFPHSRATMYSARRMELLYYQRNDQKLEQNWNRGVESWSFKTNDSSQIASSEQRIMRNIYLERY